MFLLYLILCVKKINSLQVWTAGQRLELASHKGAATVLGRLLVQSSLQSSEEAVQAYGTGVNILKLQHLLLQTMKENWEQKIQCG